MTNLSDVYVAGAGASVTVLNDQTFNSSGTWTKPTGIQYAPDDMALIELWGGGGGGAIGASSGGWITTGGAGGSYVRHAVPVSSLAATQAVAIGGGGAGGAASGAPGGDTSFAGRTAHGGTGGVQYSAAQAVYDYGLNGYNGVLGTTLYTPGAGGWGTSAAGLLYPGRKSIYGGSGGDATNANPGSGGNGQAPGGGGGVNRSWAPSGIKGGDGAPGRVRVRILRGLNQWEISEGPL